MLEESPRLRTWLFVVIVTVAAIGLYVGSYAVLLRTGVFEVTWTITVPSAMARVPATGTPPTTGFVGMPSPGSADIRIVGRDDGLMARTLLAVFYPVIKLDEERRNAR